MSVFIRRAPAFSSSMSVPTCVVERAVNSSLLPTIDDLSRVQARPLITRSTISCGAMHYVHVRARKCRNAISALRGK